jgi:hypothetical protein
MKLLDEGAAAIAAAVRTGKTTAGDVAEAAIAQVEAGNQALTAIVDFDPSEARQAADIGDARRRQGFDDYSAIGGAVEGPFISASLQERSLRYAEPRSALVGMTVFFVGCDGPAAAGERR